MEPWTTVWQIHAASQSVFKKLGIAKGADIQLEQDSDGNYPLGVDLALPEVQGKLSPAGTAESIYFPASLPRYDKKNPDTYARPYLDYVLSPGHKAQLAQGDPIRLEGMIWGTDGEPYFLTIYQVLHGGNDADDYFVAVLRDPNANGNGTGVGHTK
jgi:hypothetical protein